MFSQLRKGTLIYVLKKDGKPTVDTGEVIEVGAPAFSAGSTTFQPGFPLQQRTTVDVKVKSGDQLLEFKQLPSDANIFSYNGTTIVADNKEDMLRELESMRNISADILASIDKHKEIVKQCDELIAKLNPQVRRAAESAKAMEHLTGRVDGMERSIEDIKSMLAEVLRQKK